MNRAQRRLLSSKPQLAVNTAVQIRYGIHDKKLIVEFSQPIPNLTMTADEVKAMIAAMEIGVKELEKHAN